jgi:RNA polymerase sigma factor (sigma-70 family)
MEPLEQSWKDYASLEHDTMGDTRIEGSMTMQDSTTSLRDVRTLFHSGTVVGLSDWELLERFKAREGVSADTAFAALVARHGPMVLGVCHRLLRDPNDVADAFQATFLVLVRRARSVRVNDSLGRWLYGVSRRVALRARVTAARRLARETPLSEVELPAPRPDSVLEEWLAILDDEVARLPAKYRAAVVLCDLEGLTHEAAARQLGCPVGTVESRLSRGRERLRSRLAHRDLSPTVPVALVDQTIRAALCWSGAKTATAGVVSASAAGLAGEVLKGALMTKVIMSAIVILGLAAGAAWALTGTGRENHDQALAEAIQKGTVIKPTKLELTGRTACDPDTITKVRARFDARVEQVFVGIGQKVKKGDPLVELYSTDLAAAKTDFQTKYVQWQHDLNIYDLRQKLFETSAISSQLWIDTQNQEQKSRFDFNMALDKLTLYDVPKEVTDPLLEGLSEKRADPRKLGNVAEKAKMTLRSTAAGVVISRSVVPGNYYEAKDVLMEIAPLDRLLVWANVPEKEWLEIQEGQACEVRIRSPERTIHGKVDHVRVRTLPDGTLAGIQVRTSISNPDGLLKQDMLVKMLVESGPPAKESGAVPPRDD